MTLYITKNIAISQYESERTFDNGLQIYKTGKKYTVVFVHKDKRYWCCSHKDIKVLEDEINNKDYDILMFIHKTYGVDIDKTSLRDKDWKRMRNI